MKKLLFTIIAITATLSIYAGEIKLKSGDLSVLSKNATATIEFNYDNTKVSGKDIPISDYIEEKGYKFENKWETAKGNALKYFIKQFNRKSEGLKLTSTPNGHEKYKMIVKVRTINFGNTAKSLLPVGKKTDGGATISGKIYIKNNKGSDVCVLSFNDIQGEGQFNIQARTLTVYEKLRSYIFYYVKKSTTKPEIKEDEEDAEELTTSKAKDEEDASEDDDEDEEDSSYNDDDDE